MYHEEESLMPNLETLLIQAESTKDKQVHVEVSSHRPINFHQFDTFPRGIEDLILVFFR